MDSYNSWHQPMYRVISYKPNQDYEYCRLCRKMCLKEERIYRVKGNYDDQYYMDQRNQRKEWIASVINLQNMITDLYRRILKLEQCLDEIDSTSDSTIKMKHTSRDSNVDFDRFRNYDYFHSYKNPILNEADISKKAYKSERDNKQYIKRDNNNFALYGNTAEYDLMNGSSKKKSQFDTNKPYQERLKHEGILQCGQNSRYQNTNNSYRESSSPFVTNKVNKNFVVRGIYESNTPLDEQADQNIGSHYLLDTAPSISESQKKNNFIYELKQKQQNSIYSSQFANKLSHNDLLGAYNTTPLSSYQLSQSRQGHRENVVSGRETRSQRYSELWSKLHSSNDAHQRDDNKLIGTNESLLSSYQLSPTHREHREDVVSDSETRSQRYSELSSKLHSSNDAHQRDDNKLIGTNESLLPSNYLSTSLLDPRSSINISSPISDKCQRLRYSSESSQSLTKIKFDDHTQSQSLSTASGYHYRSMEINQTCLQYLCLKPMSLSNPKGYCFFNTVIQILRGCIEFNENIVKYHLNSKLDQSASSTKEQQFVSDFCQLYFHLMKKDMKNIDINLKNIQKYFYESQDGDDVHKSFMLILSTINTVIKRNGSDEVMENYFKEEDRKFYSSRLKNWGFIFDLFYGQMSHCMFCKICAKVVNKNFQLFKCLPLPVIKSQSRVTLISCIEFFFRPSDVILEESMNCQCVNGSINFSSQSLITHAPKYLFIYLTRGSYFVNGAKNNTFVECEEHIDIPTINGTVRYRIISVIEHIGDNENGHYYCKCNYESDYWSLISDEQVSDLGNGFNGIVSRNTIAFMFKCTDGGSRQQQLI